MTSGSSWLDFTLLESAGLSAVETLQPLGSSVEGLPDADASERQRTAGFSAIRRHGARLLQVLLRQVQSPLLLLLVIAALTSLAVGQGTDAAIISVASAPDQRPEVSFG